MKVFVLGFTAIFMLTVAQAQTPKEVRFLPALPDEVVTIQNYLEQSVHDAAGERIGRIADLLVEKDGRVPVAMLSVGTFLNLRRKVVAVPFDLLQLTNRDRRPYLIFDTTRNALNAAQGFRYNRTAERWQRVEDER